MARLENIEHGYIDHNTGEYVNYEVVTNWHNNTVMTDAKCDGVIYRKNSKGEYLKRVVSDGIRPEWFGAKADGVTNDSVAVQKAFNIGTSRGLKIKFSFGKTYLVNTSIAIPIGLPGTARFIEIEGYGAKIKTTAAITIFNRMPVDQNGTGVGMNEAVIIKGIDFIGNRTAGQRGVFIGATYGTRIEDCHFQDLDTALHLAFCLMATVDNVRYGGNVTDNLCITSGNGHWTGATTINSSSNTTTVRANRIFGLSGAFSHYKILASSGVVLYDCISEGAAPQYSTYYNTEGITVVKIFQVKGYHLEIAPTKAGFFLRATGGIVEIEGVFIQHTQTLIENISDSSATIRLKNIPWFPTGTTIKYNGTGSMYHLEDCTNKYFEAGTWINTSNANTAQLPFYMWGRGIATEAGTLFSSPNSKYTFGGRADLNEGALVYSTNQGVAKGLQFSYREFGLGKQLRDIRRYDIDLTGTSVAAGARVVVTKTGVTPYIDGLQVFHWLPAGYSVDLNLTARYEFNGKLHIIMQNNGLTGLYPE